MARRQYTGAGHPDQKPQAPKPATTEGPARHSRKRNEQAPKPKRSRSMPTIDPRVMFHYAVLLLLISLMLVTGGFLQFMIAGAFIVVFIRQILRTKLFNRLLPAKHAPPETVPRRGIRGLLWKYLGSDLYARFGWPWLAKLSKRERYKNALKELWKYRNARRTIVIVNSKGGSGKSMLTAYLAVMYNFVFRAPPLAFDVNESPGSTARRLGLTRETTIRIREFLKMRHDIKSVQDLMEVADRHPDTGAIVISSDDDSVERIDQGAFEEGLDMAGKFVPVIFCDTGNQLLTSTNVGSVKRADALIVPANVHMSDAPEDGRSTLSGYSEVDGGTYAEKVRRAIVVPIGSLQFKRKKYAKFYGVPSSQVYIIPWNWYMKRGKIAKLKWLSLKAKVTLLEILLAAMKSPSVSATAQVLVEPTRVDMPTTKPAKQSPPAPVSPPPATPADPIPPAPAVAPAPAARPAGTAHPAVRRLQRFVHPR